MSDGDWTQAVDSGNFAVFQRSRADGVDERLQSFLDACETQLGFRVGVVPDGGVRTDAALQLSFFNASTSNADTLDKTPHGRGGAVDVAPYARNAVGLMAPIWDYEEPFRRIGELAESMGLQWGGRFQRYDGPHVQVPDWRSLPYPPGGVA